MKKRRKHPTPQKQIRPLPPNPPRLALKTWIRRGSLFLIGGILVPLVITLLTLGPDGIRRIPDIPKAITETFNSVIEQREIDYGLSDSWAFLPSNTVAAGSGVPIRLDLTSKEGMITGELYSQAVRKWTIYDMALVEGKRDKEKLYLNVFDFVYGKRTLFAKLEVSFQEDSDGIMDHIPALVDSTLRVNTTWQNKDVLPKTFVLHRVKTNEI